MSDALQSLAEPPAATRGDYWCFISYRHADNKEEGRQWATWLHQAIETYEVPEELVGTRNERGDLIPERIFPVFRDEEELPADADLSNPIFRALDRSRFLVVLCSPRAVASTYVEAEIRYFKQRGKSDRVLAALIEGEPNASWDEGKRAAGVAGSRECFPRALQHPVNSAGELVLSERAEPIAADFRVGESGGQGWTTPEGYRRALAAGGSLPPKVIEERVSTYRRQCELAKLKIIAGILGIPLGMLTRRDAAYQLATARRRARVLRRWLAAVGVLALLATAGGAVAWWQRQVATTQEREANVQRGKAQERAAEALEANRKYKIQLHEASMADWQRARELLSEGKPADGLAYLGRSLRYEPENRFAQSWLWSEVVYGADMTSAVNPLPLRLLPHPEKATSVAYSPDGVRLATACADGKVRFWDAASGEAVGAPLVHEGPVASVCYNAAGTRVLTVSGKTAQVWDVATAQPVGEPMRHEQPPASAVFNREGTRVLTFIAGDTDRLTTLGEARLWDAATGAAQGQPLRHGVSTAKPIPADATPADLFGSLDARKNFPPGEALTRTFFSPDGARVLTVSRGTVARLWDGATGAPVGAPMNLPGPIFNALFSPDSERVFLTSGNTGQWWDAATGQALGGPLTNDVFAKKMVFSPRFDAQSTPVMVINGGSIESWKTGTGKRADGRFEDAHRTVFPNVDISDATFGADGAYAVFTAGNGAVGIVDMKSGVSLAGPLPCAPGQASVSLSPGGAHVAIVGAEGEAQIWELGISRAEPDMLSQFYTTVNALDLGPSHLLTASFSKCFDGGGELAFWNLETGQRTNETIRYSTSLGKPVFSPDRRRAYFPSSSKPHEGYFFDLAERKWIGQPLPHEHPTQDAVFSPDSSRLLTISADFSLRQWDANTGAAIGTVLRTPDPVTRAAYSKDGRRIVATTPAKTLEWDAATGEEATPKSENPMVILRHLGSEAASAVLSPDGRFWLTTKNDEPSATQAAYDLRVPSQARLWDATTGLPMSQGFRHFGKIQRAIFSGDGTRIITVGDGTMSNNGSAQVWECIPALTPPPAWLNSFVEALSGRSFDEAGGMRLLTVTERIRQRDAVLAALKTSPDPQGAWDRLARWILGPLGTRKLSPASPLSAAEVAARKESIATAATAASNAAVKLPQIYRPNAGYWADSAAFRLKNPGYRGFELALEDALRAVECDPRHAQARRMATRSLRALKRFDDALVQYDALLALPDATPADFTDAGYFAATSKNRDKALAIFKEAAIRHPENDRVDRMEGWSLINLNLPSEALSAFNRVETRVRNRGKLPDLNLVSGQAVARWLMEDPVEAVRLYRLLILADAKYADSATIKAFPWTDAEKTPMLAVLAETLRVHPELATPPPAPPAAPDKQ